jgi:hypothetical protein
MIRSTLSRAGRQRALERCLDKAYVFLDEAYVFLDEVDERDRIGGREAFSQLATWEQIAVASYGLEEALIDRDGRAVVIAIAMLQGIEARIREAEDGRSSARNASASHTPIRADAN